MQNYRISIGNSCRFGFEYKTSRRILMLELKTSTGLMHMIKEFVRGTEVLELGVVKGVESLLYDFGLENSNSLEKTAFGKLRILRIAKCDTLKNLFSYSFAKYLPQLQQVEVRSCGNIEAIVGERVDEVIEFTHLNSLKLSGLPNLIGFCETSKMVSFPALTSLVVYECQGLKYVFTNSMVKSLKQLKELEIRGCELMEEIIMSEGIEENINTIVLPELVSLQLENLKNLKRFSRGHPIDFPSLKVLEIYKCRAIENLVSKFLNTSDITESADEYLFNEMVTFSNLEELSIDGINELRYIWSEDINLKNLQSIKVSNCMDLKYVFPASVACGLPQLRTLGIYICSSMEVIIGKEKDGTFEWPNLTHLEVLHCCKWIKFCSSSSKVTFSNLEKLSIKGMDNLRYIWSEDMNIEALSLKNLQAIEVSKCWDMKCVFPVSVACGLLQLRKLEIKECGVEVIIGTAKDETVEWPNFTSLVVYECKSLKYAFTNSMAKSLKKLKSLEISNCKLMEEIILSTEIVEENISRIVFPQLANIQLKNLVKLKRFSSGYPIDFPSVKVLEINKCRKIENLVSNFSNRSNNNESDGEYLLNEMVTFSNLEELYIDGIDKLKYIWREDINVKAFNLKNMHSIRVCYCPDLKYVFPASAACGLPQLRKFRIYDSGVEVIIARAKDETQTFEWPKLIHLVVVDCHNLIKFGSNNSKLFPNVEVLELDHYSLEAIQSDGVPLDFSLKLKQVTLSLGVRINICNRLFGFLRRINSLERLSFTRCCLELDGLLSLDDEKEVELKHLEFIYVTNLKHILRKESQFNPILQHLHSLEVLACDDLINLAPSAASFRNLTTLRVDYCGKMTSLVTASTAKTMEQLVELRVSHCNMMEEIVENDDNAGYTEHDVIVFEKLKLLELVYLDRLNSFCSGNYKFSFPLLEQVTVRSCSRINEDFLERNLKHPKTA